MPVKNGYKKANRLEKDLWYKDHNGNYVTTVFILEKNSKKQRLDVNSSHPYVPVAVITKLDRKNKIKTILPFMGPKPLKVEELEPQTSLSSAREEARSFIKKTPDKLYYEVN